MFKQTNLVGDEIAFEAPQHVRKAIGSLGRTEDVRFSPNNQLLAIAGFERNKVLILKMLLEQSQGIQRRITIKDVVEISSPYLKHPHGVDFLDNNRIIVANREGQACIFEIPPAAKGYCELQPSAVSNAKEVTSPGSVVVSKNEHGSYEALICNNYVNTVTRHLLDVGATAPFKDDVVLLKKWIQIPDGVCVSKNRQWIGISNHDTHQVFLYKNDSSLTASSSPDGILRHYYPHGLRFASNDRLILVASAGSPYVNLYCSFEGDWGGVRYPVLTIKVLSDENYLRGRKTREEGGPKGIDINEDWELLVITCEHQPLAFFDLTSILNGRRMKDILPEHGLRIAKTLEVKCQLYLGKFTPTSTDVVRRLMSRIPMVRWAYNKGRNVWNPYRLTRPF